MEISNDSYIRVLIVVQETQDVYVEDIVEEEVDHEFPTKYKVVREQASTPNDTSRLLNDIPDVFRYFIFRHLRYIRDITFPQIVIIPFQVCMG